MKLISLYNNVVKLGIKKDPRSRGAISKQLTDSRKSYRKLQNNHKWRFDIESLTNPYADTRVLFGQMDIDIRRVLVGIDIDVAEILLADKIREKQGLDLVISHHPEGKAYANFYEVMKLQIDVLKKSGLDKDIASKLLNERMKEVERRVGSANHNQVVDAASLLDMPFMCIHTPADNFVCNYLQNLFDRKKPRTIADLIETLYTLKEYRYATLNNSPPKIVCGEPKKKAGKILVDMTGGTEGPKKVFARLSQAGINTLVCMHLSEEHFNIVKDENINVVIAGHIASDSLGMNLLFDELTKKEDLEFVTCSGFTRIKR